MKKEKIEYIRKHYEFDPNIPDIEIVNKLGDSLGAIFFEIKKAKQKLAKSIVNAFPKIKTNHKPTWQDQPTGDGYYWFKEKGWTNEIVFFDSIKKGKVKYIEGWDYLSSVTGKWYGPITPPKED